MLETAATARRMRPTSALDLQFLVAAVVICCSGSPSGQRKPPSWPPGPPSGRQAAAPDELSDDTAEAPRVAAAPSTPQWLTFYNTDLDPVRGQQNFSNLIYSRDLGQIDNASRDFGIEGMWSGPWGCEVNVSRVWGEPYCSGPTGLWKGGGGTANWTVGANWVVAQVKPRPHVRGIFLGDEPTLFGVTYADICALSLHLKRALLATGRRDVFVSLSLIFRCFSWVRACFLSFLLVFCTDKIGLK